MSDRLRNALAALLLVAAPAATASPKRTLPELIELAHARARSIAVAKGELEVREAQKSEALRLWAPSGDFTYLLTGAPDINCQAPLADNFLSSAQLGGLTPSQLRQRDCTSTVDPNGNTISVLNPNFHGVGMQLDLKITQPLYTFGKIEHAIAAAGHGVAAGRAGLDVARNELDLQVARAYWGLKATRTSLATLDDVRGELLPWVKKIELDIDTAKPQFNSSDLHRIKIALGSLEEIAADITKTQAIAAGGLFALFGEPIEIDDAELDPGDTVERPIEWYRNEALVHRPEVKQLDEGVAALRSLALARRAQMLPNLALVGGISWRYTSSNIEDSQSAYDNHANYFGFGLYLALEQPLDFVEKFAQLRHAHADAELLSAQQRLAVAGIGFEVDQAWAGLVEARDRVQLSEKLQREARGWLSQVQQNLDLGTEEPRNLIEAARAYFEQRLRYYQAIFDVNVATAQLRRATGVDVAR